MYTYQTTTDSVHVFTDNYGNIYKVGVSVGTWQDALTLLENPPDNRPKFTINNIDLDISDEAQNASNKQLTLINTALGVGAMAASDSVAIADIDGNLHTMTVADYLAIMIQYGNYIHQQWLINKQNG